VGGGNDHDRRKLEGPSHFQVWLSQRRGGLLLESVLHTPHLLTPSGFLRLGEVEDFAVGLPHVLLLLEVHLERPFDGHKGDASLCATRDGD